MVRVLSLFSGMGAYEKALRNLGIPFECVNFCEINPPAAKAYSSIHNIPLEKNLEDVCKVDPSTIKDIDLMSWSFPCTSLSLAGKQEGFETKDGERTASGLFFEGLRILKGVKPKFSIIENVVPLVQKKFKKEFEIVLKSLDEAGYTTYWEVLNARDFGVPQRRERVFLVSIRKDIDKTFSFPIGSPLKITLKDILEKEVPEKYYLSDKMIRCISSPGTGNRNMPPIINLPIARCLTTKIGQRRAGEDNYICETLPDKFDLRDLEDFLINYNNESMLVRENVKSKYSVAKEGDSINLFRKNRLGRGRIGHGVSQTLITSTEIHVLLKERDKLKLRRLTPLEAFKLMGFDEEDYLKAKATNISDTQLYKMAGNSVVVNVLEKILRNLFWEELNGLSQ